MRPIEMRRRRRSPDPADLDPVESHELLDERARRLALDAEEQRQRRVGDHHAIDMMYRLLGVVSAFILTVGLAVTVYYWAMGQARALEFLELLGLR